MDETDNAIIAAVKSGSRSAADILTSLDKSGIKISQPTLSRRILSLEEDRHLTVRGKGKNTTYEIDTFNEYFNVPAERRKPVGYDRSIVANYIPNETRWLDADVAAQLLAAGGGKRLEASTYSKAIAQKLLVDLSYASSALEGNTYSYLDTQVLIEYGQAAEGKAADETQMIINHKEAITYLVDNIAEIEIDVREVKTMHSLLSRGLVDPAAVGTVRRRIVGLGNSAYTPLAIPQLLEDELKVIVEKAAQIDDPFEQSLFLLVMISYLQFFEDVNKRTGRLSCNIPLLKAGLAPLSFMNVDKAKYIKGLLSFYELGRHDLISQAFAEGYLASANRYDAYVGRDRKETELEYKRRTDIYGAVLEYVTASVKGGVKADPEAYMSEKFENDEEGTKEILVRRASEIIASLHDGNSVAYGIGRKTFDEYSRLGDAHSLKP